MRLIDAHNHLHDPRFDATRPEVIRRAIDCGIRAMVLNGTSPADWNAALACAEAHPGLLHAALGLHPWFIGGDNDDWSRALLRALDHPQVVAVGEIGLDGLVACPLDTQDTIFRRQLAIARQCNRPVVIHCVKAWDSLFHALSLEPLPPAGALLHGFQGSPELAQRLIDAGFHLSFSPALLDPRRSKLHQTAAAIPKERFLLESDAPDQADEPSVIASLTEALARLRDTSPQDIATRSAANAEALFRLRVPQ